MKLHFAGAEIPSHRKVLTEVGAANVALSYMGLRRKIKHLDKWLLTDKFPESMNVLVDSGAYTVNKDPMAYTIGDLRSINEEYQAYVAANLDRAEAFLEFDAMALGRDWIEEQREEFYEDLDPMKFIAVWHPEWGVEYLSEMADKYPRIAIPTTDMQGRNLAPILNKLGADGNLLHGMGMTKPEIMRDISWDSVSSTSWVSPQQYGDTIVWTGRELKRYPRDMKDQARRRYRTLFEREGFDAEKIANDDSTELLRLSIWSWEKLVDDIDSKAHRHLSVVSTPPSEDDDPFAETEGLEVDTATGEVRNSVSTTLEPIRRRDTTPLPILGITTRTEKDPESGEDIEVKDLVVRGDSQRKCATCYLASKCPAFDQNATCAYDIPVKITTREEFVKVQNSLIEMQAQRVLFMRFAEEMEGGYADPNLSAEMDRLQKMLKTKNDMEQEGFSFKIEGKAVGPGQGHPGMLSRLFGSEASQKAQALPAAMDIEDVADVVDADIVDDPQ